MADSLDKLLRLAGTERVSGYRKKDGTKVSQYLRSPGDMSPEDIAAELKSLSSATPGSDRIENARRRTRIIALEREQAKRTREGEQQAPPKPSVPGGVTPPPNEGFDQGKWSKENGDAQSMEETGDPKNMARAALGSVEGLLESMRMEEGDNGPRGWDTEMEEANNSLNAIQDKLKKGEYDGQQATLKSDLEDLAQDLKDNSRSQNDELLNATVGELLDASDAVGSTPDSRIEAIRARRQEAKKSSPAEKKESKSVITNPDGPKEPNAEFQFKNKSDAQLKIMAADKNLREGDRKAAQAELDKRAEAPKAAEKLSAKVAAKKTPNPDYDEDARAGTSDSYEYDEDDDLNYPTSRPKKAGPAISPEDQKALDAAVFDITDGVPSSEVKALATETDARIAERLEESGFDPSDFDFDALRKALIAELKNR